MNILDTIYDLRTDFLLRTGQTPTRAYVGTTQWADIKNLTTNVPPIFAEIQNPKVIGMDVFVVFSDSHLFVA